MNKRMPMALWCAMLLAGCGDPPAEPKAETPPPGRPETQKLEAAGAAGYDGKALRRSVDHMLDTNDAKQKELDEARKTAGQDNPE
jgi:hypothetical protein